jgi:LPPG:FO 2-phospho-L-lactate transferase
VKAHEAPPSVIALSGGIGGAKLALGLSRVLGTGELCVVANTGDDFEHLGLSISPDLDTLLYTLAGIADPERGWGRRDETWNFMRAIASLGGPGWFRLGDADVALHVERTRRLASGESLSQVTDGLRRALGVSSRLLPMSDDPVRTRVVTDEGVLDFQHYFVRLQCEPCVRGIEFAGAKRAKPLPALVAALRDPGLRAVVVCPSNPLISIDPILAVPGVRAMLAACAAPVVAVAPLVRGRALKGPTAKMLGELGIACDAAAVAHRYGDILDAYLLDPADFPQSPCDGTRYVADDVIMNTVDDRERLARRVLAVADEIRCTRRPVALAR